MTRYAGRHRPSRARRTVLRRTPPSAAAWLRRGVPALAIGALVLAGVAAGSRSGALQTLGDASGDAGAAAMTRPVTDRDAQRASRDGQRGPAPSGEDRADALSLMAGSQQDEAQERREAADPPPAWVMPVRHAPFTSGYGKRWGRLHAGNDYGVDVGTPVRAMADGTVLAAGEMAGYGIRVDIEYADGTVSRYGHLTDTSVDEGDEVTRGEVVAESGNTGRSTGPHLHLEIRPGGGDPVDPSPWLAKNGLDAEPTR